MFSLKNFFMRTVRRSCDIFHYSIVFSVCKIAFKNSGISDCRRGRDFESILKICYGYALLATLQLEGDI